MTTITINGQSYCLVAIPTSPGPKSVEIAMNDAVSSVQSPFTGQEQTQAWPGGDYWDATITLPPLTLRKAAAWRGFLAGLRGKANVFQLSDPSAWAATNPMVGTPVVNSSVDTYNLPMTYTLVTRGWTPGASRLLLSGQQFQIGYRLHMVCEDVSADSGGNASIAIWPSLRETPADGTALQLAKPQGLFRLASNRRALQASPEELIALSFKCVEAGRGYAA